MDYIEKIRKATQVAPHVGAWIETGVMYYFGRGVEVAPHVGAWIETFDSIQRPSTM